MILYVTRDPKNMGELITINIHDVIYIETYERAVVFHTLDGEYYPLLPTLSTYEHHLKRLCFQRLDRTNLVNLQKVKSFDEGRALVFFDDKDTKNGKYGTVSISAKGLVKKWLERFKE
ncbi:LytTR family DNA-binding domain-containing protein [Paenibacillus sp.]|uniref:LytTR family DNA-binding domain-containing protein n=1 Tax=Paenibacillus sp. TaxID=58172 RepID=UPI002D6A7C07|nr:LytTR family DNA-binding domain-containing protein [Paenibacillus sp.]HZG56346.1 LytTR family DNA-binding domain-containing protein [Paenibacillus sp.]